MIFTVLLAYSFLLEEKHTAAIFCFVFTIVVFRSEVLILFGPFFLEMLFKFKFSYISKLVITGTLFGILCLGWLLRKSLFQQY